MIALWIALFPGLCLVLDSPGHQPGRGDGLRDTLDPRRAACEAERQTTYHPRSARA